ncbi:MAG: nucleoside deaminase [Candidatus Aminicenantes bacterium]|nr:MAG: nucleoside deaminase [Candidatus Aminicenantes bacterium]
MRKRLQQSYNVYVYIKEAEAGEEQKKFCYSFDPRCTHWDPIPVSGEKYHGPPPSLVIEDTTKYIQPWSGFVPKCTLENHEDCKYFPVQTSNIKVEDVYEGIERESNKWMEMACEEAKSSVTCKGGPFGAVIVQVDDETGEILRYWRNHNHVTLWNDPTAHAEVTTIRSACQALGVFDLGKIEKSKSKLPQTGKYSHCEIYSSAEPCPMCFAAISWAGIPALYFAATRYDAAQQGVDFSDEEIYSELKRQYKDRKMKVYQCTTSNSLDAFNLWKRSKKIPY